MNSETGQVVQLDAIMEQQQLQKLNATVGRLVNGNVLNYFNVVPEPKLEPKSTFRLFFLKNRFS